MSSPACWAASHSARTAARWIAPNRAKAVASPAAFAWGSGVALTAAWYWDGWAGPDRPDPVLGSTRDAHRRSDDPPAGSARARGRWRLRPPAGGGGPTGRSRRDRRLARSTRRAVRRPDDRLRLSANGRTGS